MDVHTQCPELARLAAAEGIVSVSPAATAGPPCDCPHRPHRPTINETRQAMGLPAADLWQDLPPAAYRAEIVDDAPTRCVFW
jgi:hypothetical protein